MFVPTPPRSTRYAVQYRNPPVLPPSQSPATPEAVAPPLQGRPTARQGRGGPPVYGCLRRGRCRSGREDREMKAALRLEASVRAGERWCSTGSRGEARRCVKGGKSGRDERWSGSSDVWCNSRAPPERMCGTPTYRAVHGA